jgi:hypothetical protein
VEFGNQIEYVMSYSIYKHEATQKMAFEAIFLGGEFLSGPPKSDEFHLFGGDLSTYMLRCKRCGQHVTLHGSIGDTLFYAPTAILYHWNMIEPHDEQIHRESMLMPLLFASYENYV